MKTRYFLLTEDSESVVGVIGASSNEDLTEKAKTAVSQHFEIDIPNDLDLDMENYMYGRQGNFQVSVDFDGDNDYQATINVQEVVLY